MAGGFLIGTQSIGYNDALFGGGLLVLGAASTIASVPFFIRAGSNKRKARLHLKAVPNTVGNIKFDSSNYMAVGITIPF